MGLLMSPHGTRMTAVPLSRENLAPRTVRVLNRGNRRNPDVLLVRDGDHQVVVKDFAPRGALVRATLGRWITAREAKAYRRLEGQAAVPRLLGQIDPLTVVLEYRPGRRLSRNMAEEAAPAFMDELEQAVDEMHRCGVVHLDLGHRSNVLVGEDGRPVIIDFGSALCLRLGGLAARWLLPWLVRVDLRSMRKWRGKWDAQRLLLETTGTGDSSGGGRSASRPT